LLGLLAIASLSLLCKMDIASCDSGVIHARYPTLFKGLGTLGDDYTIKISATPYSLRTPRNVAIPLRGRAPPHGVISKVNASTPWCEGMMVVPK